MNLGCEEWLYEYYEGSIVVFLLNVIVMNVLRRIYRCIILNEIVTNSCMSIMKDLPLYYTEC
jgi:hypothetical protein